jgi:hypothetical protein
MFTSYDCHGSPPHFRCPDTTGYMTSAQRHRAVPRIGFFWVGEILWFGGCKSTESLDFGVVWMIYEKPHPKYAWNMLSISNKKYLKLPSCLTPDTKRPMLLERGPRIQPSRAAWDHTYVGNLNVYPSVYIIRYITLGIPEPTKSNKPCLCMQLFF